MKTLLALSLAGLCGAAMAQTPASNPMPDGSRDMYLGVGAVSAPHYLGSAERRVRAMPLVQVEASNGMFVSGLSAGMHWSRVASLEYGPLVAIHPGRDKDGSHGVGGVTDPAPGSIVRISVRPDGSAAAPVGMAGMKDVPARLVGGAFLNYYLNSELRLTNTVLYGAGRDNNGMSWNVGLQHMPIEITPHHRITLSAGITVVNREHNAAFFGVNKDDALTSGFAYYAPGGGVRDLTLAAGWNWALSPSWMLATGVRATRLRGDARFSPLVERPTNISVSTGLAYRF